MNVVVGFNNTSEAILMEEYAKDKKINGELIPLPESIRSGCGYAFKFESDDLEKIRGLLDKDQRPYEEIRKISI